MKTSWNVAGLQVELADAAEADALVVERAVEGGLWTSDEAAGERWWARARQLADSPSEAGTASVDVTEGEPTVIAVTPPRWEGGHRSEFVRLERVWSLALGMARDAGAGTLQAQGVGTGPTAFPAPEASRVAFNTIVRFATEEERGSLERVRVVVAPESAGVWAAALDEVMRTMTGTPGAQ